MSLMARLSCGFCPVKKILSVNDRFTVVVSASSRNFSSPSRNQSEPDSSSIDSDVSKKIVVPQRKKRDEFSVLRALASTVNSDLLAPHFKYIDDPFLIPTSNLDKRTYALAKASGQKAARYVVDRYPGNFAHNTAEPLIEAFVPHTGFVFGDASLEGLMERIEQRKSVAAFESYQKVLDAGLEVPLETTEDLLDLLCFYNSEDPPENSLIDELFFHRDVSQDNSRKMIRKEWKDEGAAETLFKQMKEPSVRACCNIVRGRAKYFQFDKAFDEFQRLKDSGVKLDVATYNSVLPVALFMRDRADGRWQIVQELLCDMASNGLNPDLDTFNAVCFVLSRCSRFYETRSWFMQVINEMRSCNIVVHTSYLVSLTRTNEGLNKPSLTTWYYGLQVFYSNEDAQSRLLPDIIEYLKDKPLQLREVTDYEFFSVAMIKCYANMKNLELAYKIDHLLMSNNNLSLLGDSFREGLYYTHFLRLLCLYEQIDKTMEIYNNLTPHKYIPTFTVLLELLNAVELNEGFEHLPKIWSDLVLFQYTRRSDLVEHLLAIMAKKKQDNTLQQLFVKTVKSIEQQVKSDSMNRRLTNHLTLSGKMIGYMTLIFLNADDFKTAWETMQYFVQNKYQINGIPSEQSLVSLAEMSMQLGDVDKTLLASHASAMSQCINIAVKLKQSLSLMSDFGYPMLDQLVGKVKTSMNLTDHQRSHLDDLLS